MRTIIFLLIEIMYCFTISYKTNMSVTLKVIKRYIFIKVKFVFVHLCAFFELNCLSSRCSFHMNHLTQSIFVGKKITSYINDFFSNLHGLNVRKWMSKCQGFNCDIFQFEMIMRENTMYGGLVILFIQKITTFIIDVNKCIA